MAALFIISSSDVFEVYVHSMYVMKMGLSEKTR